MKFLRRVAAMFPREGQLALLVALGLLIPAWIKGINLLMLLAFVVIAILLVNWIAAGRQIRAIRAGRKWREPIFAGAESHWDVEIRNERLGSSSGFRLVDSGPDHRQEWFVQRIEAKTDLRLHARMTLPRRGRYWFDGITAASLHPFGLARRSRELAPGEERLVLPSLGRLNVARFKRWLAKITRGDGRLHRLARPSMIHQDDLHGLRPFRPGDNPRWIHWRTSARRNLKMVREFEEDTGHNLIVVLEPWSSQTEWTDPKFEAAVSLAATICFEWCRCGADYLMLATAGSRPEVHSGYATRDCALEILEHLAVVAAETTIEVAPLLKRVAASVVPEAPVLIVSSRNQSALSARLAATWNRPVAMLTCETASEFYDQPSTMPAANFATGDKP